MPSGFDSDEDGWMFPDSAGDETRVAPGGRAMPPVPPALQGNQGLGGRSPGATPDHFGEDAGVFGSSHPADRSPDPLGGSLWGDDGGQDDAGGSPFFDNDWSDGYDGESGGDGDRRGGGRGGMLVFLIGLVAVVLVALLFAGLNTMGILGGDDGSEAADTSLDDQETVAGEAAVGDDVLGQDGSGTDVMGEATEPPLVEQAPGPNDLALELLEDPFVCDGGTREFARLSNADPNEQVAFVSPQSPNLRSGTADATGTLTMRWNCDPEQAPTVWEITATGATSGRSVVVAFRGVVAAEAGITTEESGSADAALLVSVAENPFACNGEARTFATITGADPNEQVRFTSPESPNLRAGTADAEGVLDVRWQCDPAQAGTTWNLTATGDQSGRSVTFSVTGAAG